MPKEGIGQFLQRLNVLYFFRQSKYDRRKTDLGAIERFSSLLGVVYGLVLINPATNVFHASKSYAALSQIAPEAVWGSLFFAVGLFMRLAWVNDWRKFRRHSTLAMGCLWTFLTASFLISSGFGNSGFGTYGLISVYTLWAYIEIPRGEL